MLAGPSLVTAARAAVLLAGVPELAAALADGSTAFAVVDGTGPSIDAASATSFLALEDGALVVGSGEVAVGVPIHATRGLASVRLTDRRVLAEDAGELWARARQVASVVLAAEGLGAADRAVMGPEYAKERQAFGRPIGHWTSRSSTCWSTPGSGSTSCARWCGGRPGPRTAPRRSSRWRRPRRRPTPRGCSSTPRRPSSRCTVALGFTWEHDAHLYWRRAKVDRLLLGDEAEHLDAVARLAVAGALAPSPPAFGTKSRAQAPRPASRARIIASARSATCSLAKIADT